MFYSVATRFSNVFRTPFFWNLNVYVFRYFLNFLLTPAAPDYRLVQSRPPEFAERYYSHLNSYQDGILL